MLAVLAVAASSTAKHIEYIAIAQSKSKGQIKSEINTFVMTQFAHSGCEAVHASKAIFSSPQLACT